MYHPSSTKGKGKASDNGNDPRKSGNNLNPGARYEEDKKADPKTLPVGQLSKEKGAQIGSSPGEIYRVVPGETSSSRRAEIAHKVAATSVTPISPTTVTKTAPGTASTKSASIPVSKLCVQFCSLELNGFAECASFVKSHPEILDEDTNLVSQFAIMACTQGNEEVFQKCVERLVMINQSKDDPRYVNQLNKDAKEKKEFRESCRKVQQRLRDLAAKQLQKSQSSTPVAQQASGAASQPIVTTSPQQSKAIPISQQAPGDTQSRARKFSEGQTSSSRPGTIPENQEPSPGATRLNPQATLSSGLTPLPGRNRGSSKASLDDKHLVRRHAHAFFTFGKVFKILWHQPAGADLSGVVNKGAKQGQGIYGEPFYSAIRWMVVVKERHGHCLCCPISSHGGTGLVQRNLRAEEIRAHAIVYASGNEPVPLTNEPEMTKRPIEIKLNPDVGRINEASRVNFAKVHTIEWNYKVMEVGDVVKKHLPFLLRYCQDELGF